MQRTGTLSWLRLAALVAVLPACTPVGPEFQRPEVELRPEWLNAEVEHYDTDSVDVTEWWKQLNDPVLDDLIERAHSQSNLIRIAGLRVLESQAKLGIALGSRYPQVQVATGEASAVRTSKNIPITESGDLDFERYSLGVAVGWEIDFWGRFRRGIEAADAAMLAQIASYDELLVLITAQVADTYAAVRALEEQLTLANNSAALQRRSYEIATVRHEQGADSELDALQARTLLLSTEAIIPDLEASLQQAKVALAVLLGMQAAEIDPLLGTQTTLPNVPDRLLVGIPANLLRQRPDVRGAELAARAQNAVVGVAEANLYPSFSLGGTLGLSATASTLTPNGSSGIGDLFSGDSGSYAIGASFVWPFLNYQRIRNSIRVEDARLQQALIAYRETALQAAGEAELALARYAGARAQDVVLREAVEVAERSAELSLLRYQEGFADYQRVLNAQQSLFGQQQRYAANRGDVVRGLVAIYKSLGGGWSPERQFVDDETRQQMQERTNWGDLMDEQNE